MMAEQKIIGAVASSSKSSSTLFSKNHDVFLSFRGEDTRKNFTSHLYKALTEKEVETYIDDHLGKGDEISPALIKAIEDSRISIVIFSENYASSKWCLGELIKILDCKKCRGHIVIPVFYEIDPSHVRKQTGSYEQAFAKHEGEPSCNKWKAALSEAANIAGWDSRPYRTDIELLKDIVQDVLKKLPAKYQNQPKGLVGIEEHCNQIESLLKIGPSEIRTLGLWGMGGIGKTTLATTLYNKMFRDFEGSCFVPNVREKSEKFGNHSFDNYDMNRLRHKKALVVLDDVATSEQLEKLKVDHNFLKPGSRVIVTTRNREILGPNDEIYQVEELSSDHSLQLFCLIGFGEEQPKDGYEDLSKRVLSYCKGIPLAVNVIGASLRRKSKEAWESVLGKLQKIQHMEIHTVLKVSYDGLDDSQKDIFLDIACFFKGRHRNWVTRLLDAFDFFAASGIEVLLDKALITISEGNKIEMHDLIQEMGWEVVRQECIKDPGRQSRLWREEEVHNVLKYHTGTNAVEGIILDLQKLTRDVCLSSNFLAKMTNLRFLQIHNLWRNTFNVCLPTGLESLPAKLKYLEWERFCLESLPSNFLAEQLVELHMPYSKLKKLWDGVQNLVNLKIIELSNSQELIEFPDLSKAEKLERVYLYCCISLCQLYIHSKSLEGLYVQGCSSLKELSVTSEKLTEMDNLEFVGTNIVHISSLEELNLSETNIESLPSLPPCLKHLIATNCILETDFTQQQVLQHMIQSHIPYLYQQHLNNPGYFHGRACFFFPGDHVTNKCGFYTTHSSITIPYLSKSNLCGFISCAILCKRSFEFDNANVSCTVSHDGKMVGWYSNKITAHYRELISDHLLFGYHDITIWDRKSEVSDYFSNIRFEFKHSYSCGIVSMMKWIKGCGVFPVYATTSGFKFA